MHRNSETSTVDINQIEMPYLGNNKTNNELSITIPNFENEALRQNNGAINSDSIL